ncbi:3-oxoacyl-[acyl-carrier protein] reductase [Allocatelliglobosispora scoriae]|uniref:3-oxoacyl-[acyl-carrier protein] reductase n=1 Tax=Allocatelliglobosispora scoriae TaxID=643052 RepID=A0A841BHK0_9ACTN|nr:SDR family oxidoreductase [Allocatelliglobosispora scoriae]MBB5867764.1 3-oxoacyl-[acyl-carrier protein] reductase [Allocatelliglobosispora scoriae]
MSGRSVLVTGGSRGIGLALARRFAERGDRVAVTAWRSAAPPDLPTVRCDVRDPEQVDTAFTQVEHDQGAVEILVCAAGVASDAVLPLLTDDLFTATVDTNLGGAYRASRRAAGAMVRSRWGRIVFVSSVIGHTGARGLSHYAASKAGLVGLARSIALEYGPYGITANVVLVGYVETEMTAGLTPQRRRQLLDRIALGRAAQPAEIVGPLLWLATDEAAYVTGSVLAVDGGLSMGA